MQYSGHAKVVGAEKSQAEETNDGGAHQTVEHGLGAGAHLGSHR